MTHFKTYDPAGNAIHIYSISELASFCDVSKKEARKAWYKKITILNGFEIINFSNI